MPPTDSASNKEPHRHFGLTTLLLIAGSLGALGLGMWIFTRTQLASAPPLSPIAVMQLSGNLDKSLRTENPDFAAAMQFRDDGNYASAAPLLQKALSETTDHAEQGVIRYWLAVTEGANGNYQTAVDNLKLIAADTRYADIVRAYALQEMALTFYRYRDPLVTELVFKSSPYSGMASTTNPALSYRRLLEYTTTLYPLALSELYIADWYASSAIYLKWRAAQGLMLKGDAEVQIVADKEIIRERLRAAEEHISLAESGAMGDATLFAALERHAVVVGKMVRIGDTSFGDPVKEFRDLLQRQQDAGITADGTTRIQFAIFLARKYGKSSAADIQRVLAPIYTASDYRSPSLERSARALRLGSSDTKSIYALIASLDPKFKQLLASFGWTESDFATAR